MSYYMKNNIGGVFLTENIIKRAKDMKSFVKTSQQLNLYLLLPYDSLFFAKMTEDQIKVHYTFGSSPFRVINPTIFDCLKVYSSFSTDRKFKRTSFILGTMVNGRNNKDYLDCRVRFNTIDSR